MVRTLGLQILESFLFMCFLACLRWPLIHMIRLIASCIDDDLLHIGTSAGHNAAACPTSGSPTWYVVSRASEPTGAPLQAVTLTLCLSTPLCVTLGAIHSTATVSRGFHSRDAKIMLQCPDLPSSHRLWPAGTRLFPVRYGGSAQDLLPLQRGTHKILKDHSQAGEKLIYCTSSTGTHSSSHRLVTL